MTDHSSLGGLINSISRFIHLVACQSTKNTPVMKDFRSLVGELKLLKSVFDEILDSQMPLNGPLVKAFEELDFLVNGAREILEKQPMKTSTIFNVLRSGPLVVKIQRSSLEICFCLKSLLELSPSISLSTSIQQCIQELECADEGHISELIEFTLRDQRENIMPDPEYIMRIAESLGFTSNKDLLMESIAVEKEREKAEVKKKKEDIILISEIIHLVKQMRICMAKYEQFGVMDGLPIPAYFLCPLSLELMLDPVIVASGQTFERAFIQKWLDHGLKICPKTRQDLSHTNLVPNYTVKALIANWCEENGIHLSHAIGSSKASLPRITSASSESLSPGSGSRASVKMDKNLLEVENGLEQKIMDISLQHGSQQDSLIRHTSVPHVMVFKRNASFDERSCGHCRTDSVSSVNSTTELLSRADNRLNSKDYLESPSEKDPLSPWHAASPSHHPNVNDLPLGGSGSDVVATSLYIAKVIDDLRSQSNEAQTTAALQLRLLAKDNMENRILIAKCGAISPLVSLLHSKVKLTQENAVTALLNLSIYDGNKMAIAEAGAMDPLIHVLKCGNAVAKENSAAALFSLSTMEEYKIRIGRSGAVKALVALLGSGTIRGKKDAAAALFNLSIIHENKARIVQAGAVKPLIQLLYPETGMVDKAVAVLTNLSTIPEGRTTISQEGGIPLLIEVVESGSQRGKENAASALLQLCLNSQKFCTSVLHEGAVPPLIALAQQGTPRAKEKAQQILSHFRSQREGAVGKGKS